jgi:hypothetical protein
MEELVTKTFNVMLSVMTPSGLVAVANVLEERTPPLSG